MISIQAASRVVILHCKITPGGARPDVASVFGERYLSSGFDLTVDHVLEPGTYDIAVFAWSAVRLMCLGPVLQIDAGATYSGSLWLFAGFPSGNTYPKFQFDDPEGVYRLVWEPLSSYQPQYPFGPLLPLDDRVSNPIELIEGD